MQTENIVEQLPSRMEITNGRSLKVFLPGNLVRGNYLGESRFRTIVKAALTLLFVKLKYAMILQLIMEIEWLPNV